MGPEALAQVLRPLAGMVPPERKADLIVGLAEGDDSAVYRINDDTALVFTADFFTPVVDDPYDFGAIAAANALSDVYATGGEPVMALNLAAFPPDLDPKTIESIVRGGAEKAAEAGCAVAGGHTIMDAEPKFGMAVVGFAKPDRLFLKTGARAGDALVLTKALGTGIITTAAKDGDVDQAALAEAVASMKALNRDAARIFLKAGVRGATDVTGFSFAGHALELAEKSGVDLSVRAAALPFLAGAADCARRGHVPGGAVRNRRAYEARVAFEGCLPPSNDETFRTLLFGPETSGGLLAAVPPAALDGALAELEALRGKGVLAAVVGRCLPAGGARERGPMLRVVDALGNWVTGF